MLWVNAISNSQVNLVEGYPGNVNIPTNVLSTPTAYNAIGSWTFNAVFIDGNGLGSNELTTSATTLKINPAFSSVILYSNPATVTQGGSEVFTATVSGGSSAYTYNFMLSNSADANPIVANIITINALTTNTFTFTVPSSNNALGILTYSVKITDSATTNVVLTLTNTLTINAAGGSTTDTLGDTSHNDNNAGGVNTAGILTASSSGALRSIGLDVHDLRGCGTTDYGSVAIYSDVAGYPVALIANSPFQSMSVGWLKWIRSSKES